jgi:hypothetical protein
LVPESLIRAVTARLVYDSGVGIHAESTVRGTFVAKAAIAMALCWIALVACTTHLPTAYRTYNSDYKVPYPRACFVDGRSCLSMSPEPAQPCLTSDRCALNGSVQSLELSGNTAVRDLRIQPP